MGSKNREVRKWYGPPLYTALFHQKIGSTQQFKKEKEKKQQYKQDDNHLVTNVGSLQSRQLFVGIDCKQ